jgi:hypothetical protein
VSAAEQEAAVEALTGQIEAARVLHGWSAHKIAEHLVAAGWVDLSDDDEEQEPAPEHPCSECGGDTEEGDWVHSGYGMCASCLHNALRSGWEPGA